MRIFIDSTWLKVFEWKDGKRETELLNYYGPYNDSSFQCFIEKILTPSQLYKYVTGDNDGVYTLSKKREKIMFQEIEKYK